MKSTKIILAQTNYPGFLNTFEKTNSDLTKYSQLKKNWDDQMFGQGNFYSLHLNQLGWDAQETILNSYLMQSMWMSEHGKTLNKNELPLSKYLPESVKNIIGARSWIKKALFEQVRTIKPEVLYMHDLSILSSDDIKRIRPYIKLLVGQIACPLPLDTRPLKQYDLIISSFPHYVEMFRSWGIGSEYLQWCFEPSINTSLISGPKKYDVVFIGGYSSAHSQGNKILEDLARVVKVDFWGYGVNSLSPVSPIRKSYHGEIWGKDMYQVMRDSKMVINRHINVAGNIANNMRMFDVTGVGTLLVTDDKPNMPEFFDTSKECVTYASPKELIKKVRHYLNHPKEAEKIAKRGQSKTLKEHTYNDRMNKLSQILKNYLKNEK